MGRFELKVISTVLLVGLGALVAGTLLFKRLVRDTLAVGVNPTTLQSLKFAMDTARSYTRTKRQSFELLQDALAGNQSLRRAVDEGDVERVTRFLREFIKRYDAVERIRIEVHEPGQTPYRTFARVERPKPSAAERYRFYPFTRELQSATGKSLRFQVQFRFPTSFTKKLARTARWHRTYQALYEDIYRRERLFAERYATSYIVLFSLILVLLLAVAVLVTRSFTRRIADLVGATRDVGAGNLDVELRRGSDDELGDLIAAFNLMVAELRDNRQKIAYLNKVSGWQEIARRLAHEIKNP
ncbi:MAG: HAMP domain-containing protein, partial [Myxococcales bacterium]|nr:HAMP domain-containing protein [Myxococcales bacterium]